LTQHPPLAADTVATNEAPTGSAVLKSRLVTGAPIYYGWVIVVAAIIARVMTSPGQTYAVSIYIERFIEELGISRSLVSTLYTIGTMAAALSLPFVGRQLDKRGPRVMVGIVTALFALAVCYMSTIQNAVMLGIGFVLLRTLGQGALGMVSGNVVNMWWVRRRGAILGIAGVVSSIVGNGLFPSWAHALIGRFTWRVSYLILGGILAVVMLPIGLIFFRRKPEDYGLQPDGMSSAKEAKGAQTGFVEENWTRSEALRTPAFWVMSAGMSSVAMLSTGLQFHMVSIFSDSGLSAAAAAAVYIPISAVHAVTMLAGGMLIDRVPVRYLLFVALLGQAAALVMAPQLAGRSSALIYGAVLGMTGGLMNMVQQVVWANYFGRQHLGSIMGVASLVTIAGSALGPMPMGIARDLLGSYTTALTVSAVLPLALGVAALFTRRPVRKSVIRSRGTPPR